MNIDYIALGEEIIENADLDVDLDATGAMYIQEFFAKKQKEQDSKVAQLGAKQAPDSSLDWNPRQALLNIISDQEFPIDQYSKMVVYQLCDKDDKYNVRFTNVGMQLSEVLALTDIGKSLVIESMGF